MRPLSKEGALQDGLLQIVLTPTHPPRTKEGVRGRSGGRRRGNGRERRGEETHGGERSLVLDEGFV